MNTIPLFLFVTLIVGVSTHFHSSFKAEPLISTKAGKIQGKVVDFRGNDVFHFLGIPYAEPPLGKLRFKRSVKAKTWSGVLNATKYGPACLQNGAPSMLKNEDCLVLNVFATKKAIQEKYTQGKSRPVMVWIHGGAFRAGDANQDGLFDGGPFTVYQDVILVSLNYRLGGMGFLYLPEHGIGGNMGFWDQNLALKWVRENIDKFGGDPERVTLFGESAGSMSVSTHVLSKESRGLFKNAIMQSGTILNDKRWIDPQVNQKFVKTVGCEGASDVLACLQSFDNSIFPKTFDLMFWGSTGTDFLPEDPEDALADMNVAHGVNLLLGAVRNEGSYFLSYRDSKTFDMQNPVPMNMSSAKKVLGHLFGKNSVDHYLDIYFKDLPKKASSDIIRQRIVDALSDVLFVCPIYEYAAKAAKQWLANRNVYTFYLTQKPSMSMMSGSKDTWVGVTHIDDVPLVFGRPFIHTNEYNQEDMVLSKAMLDTWGHFAREGKPPKQGTTEWPQYHVDWHGNVRMAAMEFNTKAVGRLETARPERCVKNWPYALDSLYYLQTGPGSLLT